MDHAKVERSCIAYVWNGPGKSGGFDWQYVDCKAKGPFICQFNKNFMGFHKLEHIEGEVGREVNMRDMTLSTCLAVCAGMSSAKYAVVLGGRCQCKKGTVKYKRPIFKIKNKLLQDCVYTGDGDGPIEFRGNCDDPKHLWRFTDHGIKSSKFDTSMHIILSGLLGEQTVKQGGFIRIKAADASEDVQQLIVTDKGQLYNPKLGYYYHPANSFIRSGEDSRGATEWILELVDTEPSAVDFVEKSMESPPMEGMYPYMCREIIPCVGIQQTCGCRDSGLTTDLAIVYKIEGEIREKLNYANCLDLWTNAIDYSGVYRIGGADKYCQSHWSKAQILHV